MSTRLKSTILIVFVALFSANFVVYSSQRYSPPKAESKSYSVMNCPSHGGGGGLSMIVEFFLDSKENNGAEKFCFCNSCCKDRMPPVLSSEGAIRLVNYNYDILREYYEPELSDKSYSNLPIRSPPSHYLVS